MIVAHIELLVSDFISKLFICLKNNKWNERESYDQDKALPFRPQYLVDPLGDQRLKKNIIRNKVKPKIVHKNNP
jgi:hypothetical protein